ARQEERSYESADTLLSYSGELSTKKKKKKRAGRLWGAGHVPELTDRERQALPEGWAWTKVSQLGFGPEDAVQVGPMSMRSADFEDRGVPVMNVGCVQWD